MISSLYSLWYDFVEDSEPPLVLTTQLVKSRITSINHYSSKQVPFLIFNTYYVKKYYNDCDLFGPSAIYMEHLQYAKHCTGHRVYVSKPKGKLPALMELIF